MSRRDQIRMSEAEAGAFLAEERTVTCATQGPRGWPHLMPLWYVLRDPERSRAAPVGLDICVLAEGPQHRARRPRATLQVEAGESYEELRGVMIECEVRLHRELEVVGELGLEIFRRYAVPRGEPPVAELPPEVAAMIERQASKRVRSSSSSCAARAGITASSAASTEDGGLQARGPCLLLAAARRGALTRRARLSRSS